jgi:PAS domain-containing protein
MSEAEELLALLVDHLQDGVWLLDAESAAIVEVSRSGARQVGSRAGMLLESSFCSLIEPEITPDAWQLLVAQIPAAGSHTVGVGIRCEIGGVQVVDLTLTRDHSCSDSHGRILAITRSRNPVAERAEAHRPEPTTQIETLLDATLEALGEGVAILDHLGRVEKANTAFIELVDLHQS